MFLDNITNPNVAPFSIQNIASTAFQHFKTKPREWYKSSTICMTLSEIIKKVKNLEYC